MEKLDDALSGDKIVIPGTPATESEGADLAIIILKGLNPPVFGMLWTLFEDCYGSFGGSGSDDVLAAPAMKPVDKVGGPADGLVLRPAGLNFAELAQASEVADWAAKRRTAPPPDGRVYDFIIDRARQRWWAPRPTPRTGSRDLPNPIGFSGRWGPRVTNGSPEADTESQVDWYMEPAVLVSNALDRG